jgi:RNA polymerase sigma-70 factor, ECF subfamily
MFTDENASVDHAREGDSGAFLRLVWLYDRQIFRLARYLTESDADAEYVLLETFFQASDRLGQVEGGWNFRKLIIQIAVHQASLIHSQTETRKGALLNEVIDFAERSSADALYLWDENFRERFSSGEMEKILESAIRKLDLLARQAFVLREIEGLSIEDASRIVGLPVPDFKNSLLRARLRLPEHLACEMNPTWCRAATANI